MEATIRQPGSGTTVAVVGDTYRYLVTGQESDGRYALMEAFVPPGGGPPPHVHHREVEGFYVLEGEITFRVGEETIIARTGTCASIPIGVPHSFRNETNAPARMLISVTPAGLEEMFLEVGTRLPEGATSSAPPSKDEIDRLLAAAPRYGVEILLPAH